MNIRDGAAKEVLGELAEAEREAYVLVGLSDTLLPRLISGESRVEDTDRLIEDLPT